MYSIPISNIKHFTHYLNGLSCIYIYSDNDKCIYVGQTTNALLRHFAHLSNSKSTDKYKSHEAKIIRQATHYSIIPTNKAQLTDKENELILKYHPILNRTHNYTGTPQKLILGSPIPMQYFESLRTQRNQKAPHGVSLASFYNSFPPITKKHELEKLYYDAIYCLTNHWGLKTWQSFRTTIGDYPSFTADMDLGDLKLYYINRIEQITIFNNSLDIG